MIFDGQILPFIKHINPDLARSAGMKFPKISLRSLSGRPPSSYHSLLSTPYLPRHQIWNYIQTLPEIHLFLQSEYSHLSYFLFLDYLHTLNNKIHLPPSPSLSPSASPSSDPSSATLERSTRQQVPVAPSHYLSLDVILKSLNGLRVLSSLEIETRALLRAINSCLFLHKDQILHHSDSYRGEGSVRPSPSS